MTTRHQRRKNAAKRREMKTLRLAKASRGADREKIAARVQDNLSSPVNAPKSRCKISSVYSGSRAPRAVGRGVTY